MRTKYYSSQYVEDFSIKKKKEKKYPNSPEILFELYLKNVKIASSDCPHLADYQLLNRKFVWTTHKLLKRAISIALGYEGLNENAWYDN
jgi:hypothetical protein